MVRQELVAERGISVSLRTVERAVLHMRRALAAEARATVRFETPPGRLRGPIVASGGSFSTDEGRYRSPLARSAGAESRFRLILGGHRTHRASRDHTVA